MIIIYITEQVKTVEILISDYTEKVRLCWENISKRDGGSVVAALFPEAVPTVPAVMRPGVAAGCVQKPLEHLLLCLMSMQIHFPGGPVVVFPAEASL